MGLIDELGEGGASRHALYVGYYGRVFIVGDFNRDKMYLCY